MEIWHTLECIWQKSLQKSKNKCNKIKIKIGTFLARGYLYYHDYWQRSCLLYKHNTILDTIVTAQPQPQPNSTSTLVGVDKVISWTTHPPTPKLSAQASQAGNTVQLYTHSTVQALTLCTTFSRRNFKVYLMIGFWFFLSRNLKKNSENNQVDN